MKDDEKIEQKTFKCQYVNCEDIFSSASLLAFHLKKHLDACKAQGSKKPHTDSDYRAPGNFKTVVSKKKQLHSCRYENCNKIFRSAAKLTIHMRLHARSDHLKTHLPIHVSKEKKYECDICTCSFSRKVDLAEHIKSHDKNAPVEITEDQVEPEVFTVEDSSCSTSEGGEFQVEEVVLLSDESQIDIERLDDETICDQQQENLDCQLTEIQSFETCKNQLQLLEQCWPSD